VGSEGVENESHLVTGSVMNVSPLVTSSVMNASPVKDTAEDTMQQTITIKKGTGPIGT